MMAMETQLDLGMYGILTNTCVNPTIYKIIDKVIQSPDCINEFVEAKVDFARNEIQLIIFAFLLTEQHEDENFKLKVARHTKQHVFSLISMYIMKKKSFLFCLLQVS